MNSVMSTKYLLASAAVLLLLHHPSPAAGHPTPANSDDADFIRTSCTATLFPDLCFTSLAGHSTAVRQNPARLAKIAIAVSLAKARQLAAYVSNVSRQADYGTDTRAASAVHDCFSNVGDAVDEIRGSLKQMRRLGGGGGGGGGTSSVRFQMSNVQTWMSAALTDEETCTDGFEDIPDGPLKAEVCNRIDDVKKLTSNALALVNLYAQKVSPP